MPRKDGGMTGAGKPAKVNEKGEKLGHDGEHTIYEPRPGWRGGKLAPAWRKGQSGNPKGRPSRASILEPFLRKLSKGAPESGQGKLAVELAEHLIDALKRGHHNKARAILDVMERTDGPIMKQLQVQRVDAPPVFVIDAEVADAKAIAEGFGGDDAES